MGWNLGKKNKSSHLFEPFTSAPINGTKTKNIKHTKNNIFDKLNKFFWLIDEKNNINPSPKEIYIKCLKKKK